MKNAVTLPTATSRLEDDLRGLDEAIHYCRRPKALARLQADRDAMQQEILRRKALQTTLENIN